MAVRRSGKNAVYWKTQLPVDYIDTTLTINTNETVSTNLSEGKPAKLLYIIVEQTNNGATNENFTISLVINGTTYEVSLANAVSGTQYYMRQVYDLATGDFNFAFTGTVASVGDTAANANHLEGFIADSVGLIQIKQTTDVDVVSAQLEVNIVWEKLIGV